MQPIQFQQEKEKLEIFNQVFYNFTSHGKFFQVRVQ